MIVMGYGDERRSGAYPVAGPFGPGRVDWVARTSAPVLCSPILAGGVLVVADMVGTVYVFDAGTGELRWRVPEEDDPGLVVRDEDGEWLDPVTMAVAVWRDRAFVAEADSDQFEHYEDSDSEVRIHDLATGERIGAVPGGGYPAVVGDTLLLYGLNDGVRAFELPGLGPLWHAKDAEGRVQTVPAVGPDGALYLPGGFEGNKTHGGVIRLDPLTGEVTEFDEDQGEGEGEDAEYEGWDVTKAVHAVAAEGLVWLPADRLRSGEDPPFDGAITGRDPRTGEVRWIHRMPETPAGAVTVVDGTVIAAVNGPGDGGHGEPSFAKSVTAIGITDRVVRWTRPLPDTGAGTPVIADGFVYMAVRDGRVLALDAGSGDVRWEVDLGERILDKEEMGYFDVECAFEEDGQVIIPANGVLYVRTQAGIIAVR
ncbi:PQQ-binding-like beta-propeller repeat protein [Spirillospora sp. NPDC048824]|uniref:outer membrane protein assembly factor BamB family protein n=1 Tax=Spirillospora sp. NPDC048824 TaxID=3364526 RepID=UPI0037101C02